MSTATQRKIIDAIAECNRYIAKEQPRNADLRPASATKHLAFCYEHRAKLTAMLTQLTGDAR